MHTLKVKNVCQALPLGVEYLQRCGEMENSRAGPVLVSPVPVTTVYQQPRQRVLLSACRDANPFFHLAETAWMLAGRWDASFLDRYVSNFGERFAEPDGFIHGAYGRRWRSFFGYDQLTMAVKQLRLDPSTRQCVLAMWDPTFDHEGNWRDRPCNTHVYFRVREGLLDMTVCCRSNDIIWGAYGANAVHFSFLQEYVAARIGVSVGTYYQMSNNFHAYEGELLRLEVRAQGRSLVYALHDDRYGAEWSTQPLVHEPDTFDRELYALLSCIERDATPLGNEDEFGNRWLIETLWPALSAHSLWRQGRRNAAIDVAQIIQSEDWRKACVEWLERRCR